MKTIRLLGFVLLSFILFSASSTIKYQCLPCGLDCDKKTFSDSGTCPDCHMELVKSTSVTFRTIKPESICSYLKTHPKTLLLDVRTKEEFEQKADPNFGTLKNAVNIPMQELKSRIKEIDAYKNKEIIVYCSHSHRSPQAAYMLTQHGFKNILNMAGGMSVMTENDCKK